LIVKRVWDSFHLRAEICNNLRNLGEVDMSEVDMTCVK